MMTKKSEMAEWILDFFRRAKVDVGQVVLMRNIQNKLYELNPKERDMFMIVANELIDNGYFTYEDVSPQVLRLTRKGCDYIYNPNAKLDCCYDVQKLSSAQSRYIASWHDSFVNWVKGVLDIIDILSTMPKVTDEDMQAFAKCKTIMSGDEVDAIEEGLSSGIVTDDILDRIENLNKKLVDTIVERIKTDELVKDFLKRLYYLIIEREKNAEKMRLNMLRISKG